MKSIEIMASPAPVFTIDLGYYMENIIWLTWSPHMTKKRISFNLRNIDQCVGGYSLTLFLRLRWYWFQKRPEPSNSKIFA